MTVYENYDVIAFKSCIQIFTVYSICTYSMFTLEIQLQNVCNYKRILNLRINFYRLQYYVLIQCLPPGDTVLNVLTKEYVPNLILDFDVHKNNLLTKSAITPQIHIKLVHTKRYHFWLSLKAEKSIYHKWQFLIRTWLSKSQKIW